MKILTASVACTFNHVRFVSDELMDSFVYCTAIYCPYA